MKTLPTLTNAADSDSGTSSLNLFATEPSVAVEATVHVGGDGGTDGGSLGLDVIIARRTPVQWTEAVAVVDRACAALVREDGSELQAPDLPGIAINSNGTVDVRTGNRGESSVVRLSRTLHALTPTSATPAPLRLLITKWIASTEPHTIREFAKELAFFTRPDPESQIKVLFERCQATPAPAPQPEQTAEPKPVERERKAQRSRRPAPWIIATAGSIVAVVAMVVAMRTAGGAGWSSPATLSDVQDAIGAVSEAGVAAATTFSLGAATTTGEGQKASKEDVRLPSPSRRPAAAGTAATASAPIAPWLLGALRPGNASAPPPAADTPSNGNARPARQTVVEESSEPVYSSVDPDVNPPKMLYPQLPPPAFNGIGDVNTMEVVVSPEGLVERVRLISRAKRMTDMMLLSGAKTWQFAPALRDGESVRYRLVVSWAATP